MTNEARQVPDVAPTEASDLVEHGAYLLDVRELEEWEAGRAPAAHHIPLGELEARYTELPNNERIICICRVGARSAYAAAALASAGFDAANVDGGMLAWADARLPVIASEGDGFVL